MPELPDVAAYIDALEQRIMDATLLEIRRHSSFLLRTVVPPISDCYGKRITALRRLGKRIAIGLEADLWIVLHLMIAGRLHWTDDKNGKIPQGKNGLVAFDFSTGTLTLTEAGSKKRASLHVIQGATALAEFNPGGLEIIGSTLGDFREVLLRENHTLKRTLTDPTLFSGIGNAYSDEILHRAKLSPIAMSTKLSGDEIGRLFETTRSVLIEWIERLGAEAAERFPEKVTAFRKEMAVHGRYGKSCPVCGTAIQRIRYADNETNYCPRCQTGGKVLADRSLSKLLKNDWPRTIEELERRRSH